jgi:glycosyltransferase involved in cell wall biosynthesis
MIRAAFYAPMKPPDDPTPSGDRTMAHALVQAFERAGVSADLASRFRSREPNGNAARQAAKMTEASAISDELIASGPAKGWRLWITYHNYYKAPDLIGPAVAKALNLPYLLIEATRARKRLGGPWDAYARAAEAATEAADAVLYLTTRDAESLRAYGNPSQRLVHLPPFLPRDALPEPCLGGAEMLCVGMFRDGDKRASYELVAETLSHLKAPGWMLGIVGDGPARARIEALMAPFGAHVRFLGALSGPDLEQAYRNAGILFWPGVNEAFGMTYLEAQAAGLVVVAQDRPGVRDILAPGLTRPAPEAGVEPLAAQIDALIADDSLRARHGAAARRFVRDHHLIDDASQRLRQVIDEVLA